LTFLSSTYSRSYYRGRGAFESMGAGLDMIEGDIAFKVRCLLAS
jgi:2,3-bisphosphoglycerate-independent phosphoglycerate mutase